MKILFDNYKKWVLFLAFIFFTQEIAADLNREIPTYESLENFEAEQRIDELFLLIQKRLVIMHEVARTKWNQNLPIEDKIREQQILANLANKASQYGLDEKFIMQFFEAQIEASKEIQKNDFALWKENGVLKFEKVFSLKDELRFYIDRLNQEMPTLLSEIDGVKMEYILDRPISTRDSDHIDDNVWSLAISPLKNQ